nr:hypothetical protein [Polymorphobacter sp.]
MTISGSISMRKRRHLQRRALLASVALLGAMVPLSGVLAATCSTGTPAAPGPTAPVTTIVPAGTYGANTPISIVTDGVAGCDGIEGMDDTDGSLPSGGGDAGSISATLNNVTVIGASLLVPPTPLAIGINLSAIGGSGGVGGFSGSGLTREVSGSVGGPGGAAGAITFIMTGSIDLSSRPEPGIGFFVNSVGGAGNAGGGTGGQGDAGTFGGAGGIGRDGGSASGIFSGNILASVAGGVVESTGGAGGAGGESIVSYLFKNIRGGDGAAAGDAGTAAIAYNAGTLTGRTAGIVAASAGGRGGDGGAVGTTGGKVAGARGGDGANGGAGTTGTALLGAGATIIIDRSGLNAGAFPWTGAVTAVSNGGDGGNGASADSGINAFAGTGGNGGNGGNAVATVLGTITYGGISGDNPDYAIQAYSGGGIGGAGGDASAISGSAGGGGLAGNAGLAMLNFGNATTAAAATTAAFNTNTAVVQSVGGGGGGGGRGVINTLGGSGAAGGNGSTATANIVSGTLLANGSGSSALIAQSIGGGGGIGGDEKGVNIGVQRAIGGNGGYGGIGGTVNVNVSKGAIVASLDGEGDFGILAQSIGGAGGAGGSATSTGTGIFVLTIGGDSGAGAAAGAVTVQNDGIVTTYGSMGTGIQGQSVGGGGGDGGAAISNIIGIVPTAAVSLGGRGGSGGTGGDVIVNNTANGQVTTYGSNASGVLVQSIGGGGGTGGIATSRAVSLTLDPDIPAISVAVALGGSGGTGNTAGKAVATNQGFIATSGEMAFGMVAQSVGGGGGIGGDATALSYAGGFNEGGLPAISASIAVGASGGSGALGGLASLTNSGLVLTLGNDAMALMAQSVGGGGGASGAGDSSAVANDPDDNNSLGVSVSVGGTGGTAGSGGAASLANSGSVITTGDGADGFWVQSIGGGGGVAGGGVANAGGNQLTVAVGVGGSGGAGGDGGLVTATNSGTIVTRGVDAMGMFAQSIGGGGGEAGKGGASAGGVTISGKSQTLFDTIAGGLNIGASAQKSVDGVFTITGYIEAARGIANTAEILMQPPSKILKSLISKNLDFELSIGGQGGAAGIGGDINLQNSGEISTYGAQSDGIWAQSVGGGGGKGGTASSTGSDATSTRNKVGIGVAGSGGSAGNGGAVSVDNLAAGSIVTRSPLAFGIFGQSIGGGGGAGAQAQDVNGALNSLAIAFNKGDGAQGEGGAVTISNAGSIGTGGQNGIGIFAQSVGGGGGIVKTMTTDMAFDPTNPANNPQGGLPDIHSYKVTLSGGSSSQGDGGAVAITNSGSITTALRNAHGILAQSIGGGGGTTIGGQLLGGLTNGEPDANTNNGNGGTITLNLNAGSTISTTGDGAYGILAQSIGGGGGLAGDLSSVKASDSGLFGSVIAAGTGNGGDILVNVAAASITTTGDFAPAILLQSVAGGGGILADQDNILDIGSAGGGGTAGTIRLQILDSSKIKATGNNAPAILVSANDTGSSQTSVLLVIGTGSSVQGGPQTFTDGTDMLASTISINSPGNSVVNNFGTITATNGARPGQALLSYGPTALNNSSNGKITGDITLFSPSTIVNGGTISGNVYMQNSSFNNSGTYAGNLSTFGSGNIVNQGVWTGSVDIGQGNGSAVTTSGTFQGDIMSDTNPLAVNVTGGTLSSASLSLKGGTLALAGTMIIGTPAVANTSIDGRLLISPTGVVQLFATDHGALGTLTTTGQIGLGAFKLTNASKLAAGQTPAIVTANGGFTGTASGATDSAVVTATPVLLGTTQYAFRIGSDFAAAPAALSDTKSSVATYLNQGFAQNDAAMAPALALLSDGATRQSNSANLAAVAGQSLVAISAIRHETAIANARALYSCPTFADESTLIRENDCLWLRVEGSWATRDAGSDYAGYDWNSGSLGIGGQRQVADGWFVGGSFGYQTGKLTENGDLASISSDGVSAALSVKHQSGPLSLTVATGIGYAWFDSRRTIPVADLEARASANLFNWGLHGRAAWRFGSERVYLEPAVDFDLVYLDAGNYTETGAGTFNLEVSDGSNWVASITPGTRVGTRIQLGKGREFDLFAGAGVSFLSGNNLEATARFVGSAAVSGNFTTSFETDNTVARLTAGLRFLSGERFEARLQYDGRLSSRETWHGAQARLVLRF